MDTMIMMIWPPDAATLAFGLPGSTEWIVLLVLGLLIFGRRLPEVGRSLGRGIVEFKKGIKGIEDEIEDASSSNQSLPDRSREGSSLDSGAGDPMMSSTTKTTNEGV